MNKTVRNMIAAVTLALVASFALTQADTQSTDAEQTGYLAVTMYPGSVLVSQNTETEFESSASLQEVYAFIHERLVELGWERMELTESDVEIEVRYSRDGRSLAIDLEQEGDDRYDLETTWDD
jgi:hypothetical protein